MSALRLLKTIYGTRTSEKVIFKCVPGLNQRCQTSQPVRNINYTSRTHYCGEIGESDIGETVRVAGWIQTTRLDKFLLLRDRTGLCQVYLPPDGELSARLLNLPNESVVTVAGTVRRRPAGQENPALETGRVEVELQQVLQVAPVRGNLPFQQNKHLLPKEELRLQYRYLDLRRTKLQENLRFRSELVMKIRQFLVDQRFLDVETPTLFRRTPGGAKEFIVPSRIKDRFYSLVQSPQQFKQMLMVAGIDRYFQIARCYRDEGGKPDRQPEFTQVDIEMSFAGREDIIRLTEDLLQRAWPTALDTPILRMTYAQAMADYGVDKPDLRFENKIQLVTDVFTNAGLPVLDQHLGCDDNIAAVVLFPTTLSSRSGLLRSVDRETRLQLRDLLAVHADLPLNIIAPLVVENGQLSSSILRKVGAEVRERLGAELGGVQDGVGFIVFGPRQFVLPVLGKQRNLLAAALLPDLPSRADKLVWVVDFPLFTTEDGALESAHHPFTAPHPEDIHLFRTAPLQCRSLHYDLVLNGQEIAGGSVRLHDGMDQRFVLEDVLGEDTRELDHLLTALDSGAPPHAGIAIGLDRLVAILTKSESIRDVIAFPKSGEGRDLMAGAPAEITEEQRRLYHLL